MDDMNFPSHFLNPMIDNDLKSAIYLDVSVAMTWHVQLYNGMSKPFVSAVFSIENYIFKFVRVKLRSHNDYNFQVERYIFHGGRIAYQEQVPYIWLFSTKK